jgi:hypothetical protein
MQIPPPKISEILAISVHQLTHQCLHMGIIHATKAAQNLYFKNKYE